MDKINGIPYTTAEFNKDGECIHQPVVPHDTRELIIVSHGWNNERQEAENLYLKLFTHVADINPGNAGKFAIVGVIWPSKKFDFSDAGPGQARQAAVGAAAIGGAGADSQRQAIDRALQQFEQVFLDSGKQQELASLRASSMQLDQPGEQAKFVEQLRAMVQAPDASSKLDGSKVFFGASPRMVFKNAEQASSEIGTPALANAAADGQAAGLGDVFSGVANAVSSLLNITTYYEMKKRAGTVGAKGLARVIDELAKQEQIQHIHLVGHSFGARLVTAAAMASTTPKLHSLTLLQAAFSHNGFSQTMSGYFREVVADGRLSGPIIITHTPNDKAVGKAYAIASRISGDTAADVGDADDVFGGLGSNGARNMGAKEVSNTATQLMDKGTPYKLQNKLIHNLEGSQFIKDHGDVAGAEVAWAISQAMATAPAV